MALSDGEPQKRKRGKAVRFELPSRVVSAYDGSEEPVGILSGNSSGNGWQMSRLARFVCWSFLPPNDSTKDAKGQMGNGKMLENFRSRAIRRSARIGGRKSPLARQKSGNAESFPSCFAKPTAIRPLRRWVRLFTRSGTGPEVPGCGKKAAAQSAAGPPEEGGPPCQGHQTIWSLTSPADWR